MKRMGKGLETVCLCLLGVDGNVNGYGRRRNWTARVATSVTNQSELSVAQASQVEYLL